MAGMWCARVLSDDADLVRQVQSALEPEVAVAPPSDPEPADLVLVDQRSRGVPLRRGFEEAAVVVLVGGGDFPALEAALAAPVDDAVQIPADSAELRARALAALRRRAGAGDLSPVPWYDRRRREVLGADGVRRRLTRSECVLLERLLEEPGAVVPRESLLWCLAARPLDVESNIVERHVATLRAKLRDEPRSGRYIQTVTGRGYRIRPN